MKPLRLAAARVLLAPTKLRQASTGNAATKPAQQRARAKFFVSGAATTVCATTLTFDAAKPAQGTSGFVNAEATSAPDVPKAIERKQAATVRVHFTSEMVDLPVSTRFQYRAWTFNRGVPGPFVRARVGDVLEVHHSNLDTSGMPHNIDFHAILGPGGGSALLLAESGQTKMARFKLQHPGLFIYHCAAAPVPIHIANGMYGLLLVEPEEGLPPVDREYYIMRSEWYPLLDSDTPGLVTECDYQAGLREQPELVTFNGKETALITKPLVAKTGETVVRFQRDESNLFVVQRLFVGNAGPNQAAAFHVIGGILSRVYREGDLISPPARSLQTTLIPPGGAAVVELEPTVPGTLTLVDHSIFRMDKGAVGFLNVLGSPRPDLYASTELPQTCAGCKLHA